MLEIIVPEMEFWDERTSTFINTKFTVLKLEHSLKSMYKWESKWKRPFITKGPTNRLETIDYVKCMTLNEVSDPNVYMAINDNHIRQINAYISDSMTASTFKKDPTERPNREIITSEIIYYLMFSYGIPIDCENWHLNQLFTLLKTFEVKSKKPKKQSAKETMATNSQLNAMRRRQLGSTG